MKMKRVHIALAVRNLNESMKEYSKRLGVEPCCIVEGTYALWRTDLVNLSISEKPETAGTLRHLGFEDSQAQSMSVENDINGFEWERFTEAQQREEIIKHWPHARFYP
jgi:hypothetical protein